MPLAEVGQRFGVTASWVGFLERRTRAYAAGTAPPPSLTEALRHLSNGPLRLASDVALELYAIGIVRDVQHPAAVAAAARLMSLSVGFTLLEGAGRSVVIPAAAEPVVRSALANVRSLLRRQGIVELTGVAEMVALPVDVLTVIVDADRRLCRRVDAAWLVPDARSHRLPRTFDRMLAVGTQTLDDLHGGLQVAWRYLHDAEVPPVPLLRAYIETQPYYRLDEDRVELVDHDLARLTPVDRAILAAFTAEGVDVLPTRALCAALVEAGLSVTGAPSLIITSPLLLRVTPGGYRLRRPESRPQ